MNLWERFLARVHGPMAFRLILQPLVATFIGVRAGLKDAAEGRPVYVVDLFKNPARRRELLREGWRHVSKVFLIAVLIDCVFQFLEFHRVRITGALTTAAILAPIPYAISRGLATWIARRLRPPDGPGANPTLPK